MLIFHDFVESYSYLAFYKPFKLMGLQVFFPQLFVFFFFLFLTINGPLFCLYNYVCNGDKKNWVTGPTGYNVYVSTSWWILLDGFWLGLNTCENCQWAGMNVLLPSPGPLNIWPSYRFFGFWVKEGPKSQADSKLIGITQWSSLSSYHQISGL